MTLINNCPTLGLHRSDEKETTRSPSIQHCTDPVKAFLFIRENGIEASTGCQKVHRAAEQLKYALAQARKRSEY